MSTYSALRLLTRSTLNTRSRSFLSKGPSAAKVENVEYKKDVKGASDNDIKSVLGDNISGYEVR